MKKSFETLMVVDGKELPLNIFVQETIGNIRAGFSKTLKGMDQASESIEICNQSPLKWTHNFILERLN